MGETLTSKDLTKFAYGVAKGMEFLVTKGVSIILTEKYIFFCKRSYLIYLFTFPPF